MGIRAKIIPQNECLSNLFLKWILISLFIAWQREEIQNQIKIPITGALSSLIDIRSE